MGERTQPTIMAISGPRPKKLCNYYRKAYVQAVNELEAAFRDCYAHGIRTFLFGGAQGIDQLAFWAAYRIKQTNPEVALHVYVPFPGQESIWLKTGLFSQAEYKQMLDVADKVIYVDDQKPTTRSGTVTALMARNACMVRAMDIGFVVSNADHGDFGTGGTAAFWERAVREGKPVIRYKYETYPVLHLWKDKDRGQW